MANTVIADSLAPGHILEAARDGAGEESRAGGSGAAKSRAGRPNAGAGLTIAAAVAVLAAPSAVLGFGIDFQTPISPQQASGLNPLDALHGDNPPEHFGARLARGLSLQFFGHDAPYAFTPATNPNRPDRSVTVAVRLDPQALSSVTLRNTGGSAAPSGASPLAIAQTGFNLGVARGYRNFAPDLPAGPVPHRYPADLESRYSLAPAQQSAEPHFAGHGASDDRSAAGGGPRTFVGDRDDQGDLGGSYRLTRNLAVTAGLRDTENRERLKPLTDGNLDNQAVYVGTKFKF